MRSHLTDEIIVPLSPQAAAFGANRKNKVKVQIGSS